MFGFEPQRFVTSAGCAAAHPRTVLLRFASAFFAHCELPPAYAYVLVFFSFIMNLGLASVYDKEDGDDGEW